MTLSAGTRLGPYEILSPLGAGGMGEVWRARDTRLGREVAIKVLPSEIAADPGRLKRFEKEARSASALNHPNIVTIYDIGSSDDVSWIAMEKVDGKTLRELLFSGPLPIKKLLPIAVQIADGLAKAHEAGIVHRDLKPENVMVTKDGLVKILDFGLAKLTQTSKGSDEASHLPTETGTSPGVILGTVGYMSPEQAAGQTVDFRSDQFSFGSILYEMATGKRAFQKGTAVDTLSAILHEDPKPIVESNPEAPAPLRWIVERCLAKEARNRYASTEDLARELATVRDHLSEATNAVGVIAAASEPVRRRRLWMPAAIAAAVLLAAGATTWRLRSADFFWTNPLTGARFSRFTDWEGSELDAAISPDGKFVAFLSNRGGPFDAWVGQVGGGDFLNLTKGQNPQLSYAGVLRNLGFSGDGTHVWIHFVAKDGKQNVWFAPTMGGVWRPFIPTGVEVAWSPDGSRMAYHPSDEGDPIFIAGRNGENPRRIFIEKPGIHNHYPTWSPDGRFVYFVRGVPPSDMDIWRIPSAGGVAERLTQHHSGVKYPTLIDSRTLIYTVAREDGGSGLYAMDVERRIPHPVTSGLEEYFSVAGSADGRRLVASVGTPARNLWTVPISDRIIDDAGVTRFDLPAVRASAPRFGPDYLLYLSSKGGANGLWKFKHGVETELWKGSDGAVFAAPAISPDGNQICFVVRSETKGRLYLMSADGTGAHRLAESLDVLDTPSWSPDGKWIAVVASEVGANPLFRVPVDGGPAVRVAEGVASNPVWSPDGRFILYSEGKGGGGVRLRAVTPEKEPISLPELGLTYTGNRYRFLPDAKSLVVMRSGGGMRSQNFWLLHLATGNLRQLTNLRPGFEMKSFDVSPDGKRILFDRFIENSDIVLIDLPRR